MARKSRKETVITAEPVPSLYVHVALYIRLSVEDNKKRGCSVENQKLVLNDFLADKPDFVVYDTYIDNGMTGTNFHRPGFQQMLSDIEAGNLRFSAEENCLYCKGKPVALSKTELKMLTYMLKDPKKAFPREEILDGVWGFDTEVETRVTDETLRRIRRKLSLAGSNVSIGTIWGFGYRISIAEDKK